MHRKSRLTKVPIVGLQTNAHLDLDPQQLVMGDPGKSDEQFLPHMYHTSLQGWISSLQRANSLTFHHKSYPNQYWITMHPLTPEQSVFIKSS